MITDIDRCMEFFRKGFPRRNAKSFRTQLGVFCEEIAETLDSIESTNSQDNQNIINFVKVVKDFSDYLKKTDCELIVANRLELADGLADTMVTAIGVAYGSGINIEGAFNNVVSSNLTKFDDNGYPILDENGKIVKSNNYRKPELTPFI
jgi:predicted HAD superfamily Cof-like phosphohydrolase